MKTRDARLQLETAQRLDAEKPRLLTTGHLEALKACAPKRKLFDLVFPYGAYITPENLSIAREEALDVEWLTYYLLDTTEYQAFNEKIDTLRREARNALSDLYQLEGQYAPMGDAAYQAKRNAIHDALDRKTAEEQSQVLNAGFIRVFETEV